MSARTHIPEPMEAAALVTPSRAEEGAAATGGVTDDSYCTNDSVEAPTSSDSSHVGPNSSVELRTDIQFPIRIVIYQKLASPKPLLMMVGPGMTVTMLKHSIERTLNIPAALQRLLNQGKELTAG